MEMTLKGTPKEITALVLELQERQNVKNVKLTDHEVTVLTSAIYCKITLTERYIEDLKGLIEHGANLEAHLANETNTIEELNAILQKLI